MNQLIETKLFKNSSEISTFLEGKNIAFLICFYGANYNYKQLYEILLQEKIPFIGCMDIARLVNNEYYFEEDSLAVMIFSKDLIEKIQIISYDMRKNSDSNTMYFSSLNQYNKALEKMEINKDSPDMEREFAINLAYGLQSANTILKAQNEASLFMQTVGGSSGGKLDFITSSVISSKGMGAIGATAIIRLKPEFTFYIDRVSSFEKLEASLKVTKLSSPRHILELNGNPAAVEYAKTIGKTISDLAPEVYATFTLGIEPGDGERLITSIMKGDGKTGLLTYNDLIEGTELNLYKAVLQESDRETKLSSLNGSNIVGYISFDCVLCYLSRNANSEIQKISGMYKKLLPNIPQIGFGTFGENICGANVNQTETFILFMKK